MKYLNKNNASYSLNKRAYKLSIIPINSVDRYFKQGRIMIYLTLWLIVSKLSMFKKYNSKRMYNNIYNFSTFSETLISIIGFSISWNLGGTL